VVYDPSDTSIVWPGGVLVAYANLTIWTALVLFAVLRPLLAVAAAAGLVLGLAARSVWGLWGDRRQKPAVKGETSRSLVARLRLKIRQDREREFVVSSWPAMQSGNPIPRDKRARRFEIGLVTAVVGTLALAFLATTLYLSFGGGGGRK
jgi:hypothetical protein